MTLEELNRLPAEAAGAAFRSCCGSRRWVEGMVAGRPYAAPPALLEAADRTWAALGAEDWDEAFAHHPRIGEARAAAPVSAEAAEWSRGEQRGMSGSRPDARAEMADLNQRYEARFGRIYIVSAAGRGPGELLDDLRRRLGNAPGLELRIAAEEQRKITQLRLRALLATPGESSP